MTGGSLILTDAEILLEGFAAAVDCRARVIHLEDLVLRSVDSNHLAACIRTPVYPVLNDVILNQRYIAGIFILEPAIYAKTRVSACTCCLTIVGIIIQTYIRIICSLFLRTEVQTATSEKITAADICAPFCRKSSATAKRHGTAAACAVYPHLVAVAVTIALMLIRTVANGEFISDICRICRGRHFRKHSQAHKSADCTDDQLFEKNVFHFDHSSLS